MPGFFLSFSHPSPVLLVGLALLPTHLLWAQRTSTVQLPDAPSQVARVSEAQTLHVTYRRLPLTFEQNQGYRLPMSINATSAALPSKWLTFAPTYGKAPHETTWRVENLEHYVHRIPGAGSVIRGIGQEAKAHPQVTRVITVFKPQP